MASCSKDILRRIPLSPWRGVRLRSDPQSTVLIMRADGGEDEAADDLMMCCAACGIAEVDGIKLKRCTACKLVRYCSVECQKNHRKQHKKECSKRAAELRDEILFKQPETNHFGECPICCLPQPLDATKSTMKSCCSKLICNGCIRANKVREMGVMKEHTCPFCRTPTPETMAELEQNLMKRVEANDPVALREFGNQCYERGDYSSAFDYATRAARLGNPVAHNDLVDMYLNGHGVERNEEKKLYHAEKAAIGGHPKARFILGLDEWKNGRTERGLKHFMIAANLGCDLSLKTLKEGYASGCVSKEDLTVAFRAHQAAIDATNSAQREEDEKARRG